MRRALDAGMTLSRVRAADLESPFHGVRRIIQPAPPPTDDQNEQQRRRLAQLVRDCTAFAATDGRPTLFTHVTAARLYGIPVPWHLETRRALDVSAVVPAHAPQGAGVIGHRLVGHGLAPRTIHGLLVPDALDVWVQLATLLTAEQLIIAGDGLVTRKHPLTTLDRIHERVSRLRGGRGVRRLREAAPDIRSGTDSAAETRMRLIIIRGGLPEPAIGHTVYDRDGCFVGTPDLAYVDAKIALDYEGSIHRTSERVFGEDIERREQFQDAGWRHIRIVKDHLERPHRLVDRVGYALAERHHHSR